MKYLLVDKYDNIVTSVDLASNVGMSGARTSLVQRKMKKSLTNSGKLCQDRL